MFKCKVAAVIVVIVCLQFVLLYCEALKITDEGVCQKPMPQVQRRTKRITNWKICKPRKSCVRNETYVAYKQQVACCPGWVYQNSIDSCRPHCRLGCKNGTCAAPDDCRCVPPLILEKNACVAPTCDPPCINGHCSAPNTCSCEENLFIINNTICAPRCPPGYFNDPIECVPKCDEVCLNATCTGPNTCTCVLGHQPKDNFTCVPHCKPSCLHGECSAPNVCSCFEGYTAENVWKCKPVCDACEHGRCIAPNICECNYGYLSVDGVCVPQCDKPCQNGVCSEPNTCTCNVGYKADPDNKFNCSPICEPKCVNASCVSPNTCSCHFGYETTGYNWTCKPRCDECFNGECIGPNNCRCDHGYSERDGKCSPDCSEPCKNGSCSKPDICSCDEGFELDLKDRFVCRPVCKPGCVNSTCVSPGRCECLDGYESTGNQSSCKPKCSSCYHGDCVAPGDCMCHEGYYMTHGICSPICSTACVNGYCSSPNKCTCRDDYVMNATMPSICYRECSGPCDHGRCDIHGKCICDRGYELLNGTCLELEPVECNDCASNCTNGVCWCADGKPCIPLTPEEVPVAAPTSLAGLGMTWMFGGALCLLLVVLVIGVIYHMGRGRRQDKTLDEGNAYGSVMCTIPNTFIQNNSSAESGIEEDRLYEEVAQSDREEKETTSRLLNSDHVEI